MATKNFPFGPILDDAGALVAGATVAIASVKDMSGTNIAAHGATLNDDGTGLRVSVAYDPLTKGEAWISLSVSKAGSTITGINASPTIFAAADANVLDATKTVVDAITAKTTNLPPDPADASDIAALFAAIPGAVWGAGARTLTTVADSAGVTTLVGLITNARMTLLDRLDTMIEQIGTSGVWRFLSGALSQAPTGAGQLVQGRFQLVADEAGADGVLEAFLGDTRTLRCQMTDGAGVGIDLTGATLAAKLVDLAATTILDSTNAPDNLTLSTVLASEGRIEIVLPLSDIDLVAGRRYKLLVYRTVGGRRSTFPLDVLIGG